MLNAERRAAYINDLDALNGRYGLGADDAFDEMAAHWQGRAANEQGAGGLVASLYESIAENLRGAALDLYASTK